MRVFGRVTVRRIVAAQCRAAGLASAQMNPRATDLYAFLAFVAFGRRDRGDRGNMGTSIVRHNLHFFQKLVSELDAHRSFADGGSDAFDRTGTHIAGGEDAGPARFEQERLTLRRPVR